MQRAGVMWVLIVVLSLLVMPAGAQESETPVFEPAACFEGVIATECGYVLVPEDRSDPDSPMIKLAVAITRSTSSRRVDDPVFLLSGGPGEHGVIYAQLAPLFNRRDFIAFDQRGVNNSQPSLDCPEYLETLGAAGLNVTEEVAQLAIDLMIACGQRLAAEGVNLSAYTTTESAADVDAIRRALGYDRINLFGVSYGTRLAQEVMRAYPETLRSVVMDSVIPTQLDRPAATPLSADASLRMLFAACAADAGCDAAYPDLEAVYAQLYADLQADPPTVSALYQGEVTTFPLNGDSVQAIVFLSLYNPALIAELPGLIYALRDGNYDALGESTAWQFAQQVGDLISWGKFVTTECRGEVAFSDPAALEATYEAVPNWRSTLGASVGISSPFMPGICAAWGVTEPSGAENDPVISDVPTLLLGGQFDPVTPPQYLDIVAEGLTNVYSYVFMGQSHAVSLATLCGLSITASFINDPSVAPGTACMNSMTGPAFVLPE